MLVWSLLSAAALAAPSVDLWGEGGPGVGTPGWTGAARGQAWFAEAGPLRLGGASGFWLSRSLDGESEPFGNHFSVELAGALAVGPLAWVVAAGPGAGTTTSFQPCGPNQRCKETLIGTVAGSARTGPTLALGPLLLVGEGHAQAFAGQVLWAATVGVGMTFDLPE